MTTSSGFGHERGYKGKTNVWLTPPEIIEKLGPFDLDPCSPIDRPWDTAKNHLTEVEDGLSTPWSGFVWCNPPYGPDTGLWLEKLSNHKDGGIALVFARTETASFFNNVWPKYDAMLFLKGRLSFYRTDGSKGESSTAPSVLIGYGDEAVKRLRDCGIAGHLIYREAVTRIAALKQEAE